MPAPRRPQKPRPPGDLREVTARNQLRFLRTEVAIARGSLSIALRHTGRHGHGVAKRLIALAEHAYTSAAGYLAAARIEEGLRAQLRRDLVEIRRALNALR